MTAAEFVQRIRSDRSGSHRAAHPWIVVHHDSTPRAYAAAQVVLDDLAWSLGARGAPWGMLVSCRHPDRAAASRGSPQP